MLLSVTVGLFKLAADNPIVGNQVYPIPPEAFKVTFAPLQILSSGPALAIGGAKSALTSVLKVAVQLFVVLVTNKV